MPLRAIAVYMLTGLVFFSCQPPATNNVDDNDSGCVSSAEVCDGVDNDCDTTVDNEPNASNSCDDADPCTVEVCQAGGCLSYRSGLCDTFTPLSDENAPAGRYRHSAVFTGTDLIVWGGFGTEEDDIEGRTLHSGGRFHVDTGEWEAMAFPAVIHARYLHSTVWTGSEMIVWGGATTRYLLATGARYNAVTNGWSDVTETDAPAARRYHSAVWTGQEMIVWGGEGALDVSLDDGARYRPLDSLWFSMSNEGAPEPRNRHNALWTGTEMIIWGGYGASGEPIGTGGLYNPSTDSWRSMSNEGAPSGRVEAVADFYGGFLVIYGGLDVGGTVVNDSFLYDPASDSWKKLADPAISGRMSHSGLFCGEEFFVWGGTDGAVNATGGAAYSVMLDRWRTLGVTNALPGRAYPTVVCAGSALLIWGGFDMDTLSFRNDGASYPVD